MSGDAISRAQEFNERHGLRPLAERRSYMEMHMERAGRLAGEFLDDRLAYFWFRSQICPFRREAPHWDDLQ